MTTYFSLNITNRCNKACPYCINADYINKAEYPDLMGFEDLRNWLEIELHENDIAEISGTGEPTLCEWLPDLLRYLEERKAWAILRTNGFGLGEWRLPLQRLLAILSKHNSGEDYIKEKCKFLLPHDLILTGVKNELKQGGIQGRQPDALGSRCHDMEKSFFVTPDGKVRPMSCEKDDRGTVWDYRPAGWTCTTFCQCSFLVGAHNFIEYLKNPVQVPLSNNHKYMQIQSFIGPPMLELLGELELEGESPIPQQRPSAMYKK